MGAARRRHGASWSSPLVEPARGSLRALRCSGYVPGKLKSAAALRWRTTTRLGELLTQQPCRLAADSVKATKLNHGDLRQLLEAGVSLGGEGAPSRQADPERTLVCSWSPSGKVITLFRSIRAKHSWHPVVVVGGLLADPRG